MIWDKYPLVAVNADARAWIVLTANRGKAPNTLDAYARCLNDYLAFCERAGVRPEAATEEYVALYINDMRTRPGPWGDHVVDIVSGSGLKNATMQQRLTVVRLWYDDLVRRRIRKDNPAPRGYFSIRNPAAGRRGLLAREARLPWIPHDEDWIAILRAARREPLRNKVMLLFAYEGALRREELCSLCTSDVDAPHRAIRIRAETTKGGRERVVVYSCKTGRLYAEYLRARREMFPGTARGGPIFLSESNRNYGSPVKGSAWDKIIKRIGWRTGSPDVARNFSTHTLRHLYLTELARAGWDTHEIMTYAGHRSSETTMIYIHLSGRDLTVKVAKTMRRVQEQLNEIDNEDGRDCDDLSPEEGR